ncbi:hypothetical protein [Streptomyces sp. NPDC056399]|uniref:hypothetical protein n=1 Tax=Streptomyces sp. NPDC056399 TaxID=3345807 RepID=UPI0035D9ADB8
MNRPRVPARLLAREPLPGVAEALGSMDGFLLRDGAHWFVTRHDGVITVGRVSVDPSQVLARRATWSDPAAGADTYCSPLPDGALAVSGREAVTVHEPDGTVRWVHRHRDSGLVARARGLRRVHTRLLVAAAEEPWAEEATHRLLDGRTLRPLADVAYPRTALDHPVTRPRPGVGAPCGPASRAALPRERRHRPHG